jgi:glutamate dehydrogenase (NAD(P)+)
MLGEAHPGVITGKPIPVGGSFGRGDATARGGVYAVREACTALGIDPAGAAMVIQGFGNAGQYAALLGESILGLKVVAVSDSSGAIYDPNGFSAEVLVEHKLKTGRVAGFPGADPIDADTLLELDAAVLVPAALENAITERNARNVKAKIVCELANGPTTPDADAILYDNGVFVIPDFLANAGGVTVSYFEQVQNSYNYYWHESDVHRELDRRMTEAFGAVYDLYETRNVGMRTAAYMISIDRVATACRLRGWI